mmetsp:Transcript_6774/g.6944  ORF Transcript_6774/g.6944 Transcript_6774/m.6944 type:complete len:113 (+) Transcript_6774:270-608(+)
MTMSLVAEPVPHQYFIQYERPSSIPLRLGTQRDRQTIPTRTTSLTLESSQSNLRQPSTLNPQLLLLFGVVVVVVVVAVVIVVLSSSLVSLATVSLALRLQQLALERRSIPVF